MCYYKTTNGRGKQNIKEEKMRKKPMLAYPVSDKPINYDDKVFMQPKLDGVRCVIQYDNSEVKAYSRTGKEFKNIKHILIQIIYQNLSENYQL